MTDCLCPECQGLLIPDHPAGLVFRHTAVCPLLPDEDARQAADVALLRAGIATTIEGFVAAFPRMTRTRILELVGPGFCGFVREATATEIRLCAAAGMLAGPGLKVAVYGLTRGVRARNFIATPEPLTTT